MKKQRVFHCMTGPDDAPVLLETEGWAEHYNGIDVVISREVVVDSFGEGGTKPVVTLRNWIVVEPLTGKSLTKAIQINFPTRAAALQALPQVFEQYGYEQICEKILYFIAKQAAYEQEHGPIRTIRIGDYIVPGDAA